MTKGLDQQSDNVETLETVEVRPTPFTDSSASTINPSKSVQTFPQSPTREELQQSLSDQSERIFFLESSLQEAASERITSQEIIDSGRLMYAQLSNAYEQLQQQGIRMCTEYEERIENLQSEVEQLRRGNFVETRILKQYKELGESARTKLKRKFRDAFVGEMNEAVKKRGLEVVHIEMRDMNDGEDKIRVNALRAHTYSELTPLEKLRVQDISDVKSIRRISNITYAALRSFAVDLSPLIFKRTIY